MNFQIHVKYVILKYYLEVDLLYFLDKIFLMQSNEEYQKEEENNERFLQSLMNTEKYDKKDDFDIIQLGLKIKNYHLPNWKNFPKSSMKRTRKTKNNGRFCPTIPYEMNVTVE